MKTSIINGSEVSRLSVAIQFIVFWDVVKGSKSEFTEVSMEEFLRKARE